MDAKFDCTLIKKIISMYKNELNVESIPDIYIIDMRAYICAHGLCIQHYKRSHRRMSEYNWKKICSLNSQNVDQITKMANELLNIITNKSKNKQKIIIEKCENCNYSRYSGIKHIHFIKGTEEDIECANTDKYEPIENLYTIIDNKAEKNNIKLKSKDAADAPAMPIQQINNHRMSYGDLNYLGQNKALLYFDRGIRGKQTFINSMSPLKNQPKYKDLIVVDDIVFTSSCKCDSDKQHKRMFPHYRITCAVGLTCPAKLTAHERLLYTRDRNATTEPYTTARAMLVRYW